MLRRSLLCGLAIAMGCTRGTRPEYFATESAFFRLGVDRDHEEREVRRVLGQRALHVVAELRSPEFVAIGATSLDGKVSAVRVITERGVVIAEDAQLDDLFAPARVALLEDFPSRWNDLSLVGVTRIPSGLDAGCVTLRRILPDGSAVNVGLDVSAFGSHACVVSVRRGVRARLEADVGFPGLSLGLTATLRVELAFQTMPLGKPAPVIRVARAIRNSGLLEVERHRLYAQDCAGSDFSTRHAKGVARAALSLFTGESTDRQIAAYRECIGSVQPGSSDAESVASFVHYVERGWLNEPDQQGTDDMDGVVIEPFASE